MLNQEYKGYKMPLQTSLPDFSEPLWDQFALVAHTT
jgi:hypothetical protein